MTEYFNSLHLEGETLEGFVQKAKGQNREILLFFKSNAHLAFTPHEINEKFPNYPITSIRRAMTVLTGMGLLEKINILRQERYGSPNAQWRLNQKWNARQLTMFSQEVQPNYIP